MRYIFYQYDLDNFRFLCLNSNESSSFKSVDRTVNTDNSFCLEKSISRSKRVIREYALCNDFEWFCTFTIASQNADRFSLQSCEDNLRRRLKSYKQYHKDFIYLLIPEKHENGAFHFHGLMGGIDQKDLILFNINDFDKLPYYILRYLNEDRDIYYFKQFFKKTGFCTLTRIENKNKSANYITKYITKEPIRNENGTLYICCRGLKRSYSYDIKPFNFDKACEVLGTSRRTRSGKIFHNYYSTEFVKSIDVNLRDLDTKQIQWIQDNINEYSPILDYLKTKIKKYGKGVDF